MALPRALGLPRGRARLLAVVLARARDASRAELGPDVEWRLFWDRAGDGDPESNALYLECRRRERRGLSRDAERGPAPRFPGAGTKRAAMRRETRGTHEVHACFSFALLPGPDAKKHRADAPGEDREAARDDVSHPETSLDENEEKISVADEAAPTEVSRLNLAGPVVEMVASLRETLGWTSRGRVGVAGDASADASASFRGNTKKSDDDDDARACACGTRRCVFLALPRADTFRLRMDRLMAHRFVLPPCETFLRGREAVSLDVAGDATDDEDFQKEEPRDERASRAWGAKGFASREALVGDALVCLSFHDEVAERFVAEAAADEPPRAREGGDDSGYDDSGYDEAEGEEAEGGRRGDASRDVGETSAEKKKSVPPRRLPRRRTALRDAEGLRDRPPRRSPPWAPPARPRSS